MKNLPIQITLFIFLLLFASTSIAQTFWGMTSNDGLYGGGAIFSFDAKTDSYQTEYVFKPSPVYNAFNVFEQSPDMYIGVCDRSYVESIYGDSDYHYLYQYDALKDTTEIIYEFPGYFTQSQYQNGEADIIYFNNSIIGMLKEVNNDTMTLINYSLENKTLTEIAKFNTDNWPGEGNSAYSMNACYFSPVNDTTVLFSLGKFTQLPDTEIRKDGREFYSYNPQKGTIGILFTTSSTENINPYGPFIKTSDNRLLSQIGNHIMEVKLADSSYSFMYPFSDNSYITQGKLFQATDSTLVGLRNVSSSGYLFEYDFKNDDLIHDYYLWSKAKRNSFVAIGDSLYFYAGDNNPQILVYKPGGEEPKLSYELNGNTDGFIDFIFPISDPNSLMVFASGLAQYYPDKKAYVPGVRFSGNGAYYSYKYGATPTSDLLLASNGKLYGTTSNGGFGTYSHGDGVLFEIDPQSKKFQLLLNFKGDNGGFGDRDSYGTAYGKNQNNLIEVNQKLYGTTYTNGDYEGKHSGPGYGVIYTYDISRNYDNYRKIFDFNDSTDASAGRLPMSGLTKGANDKLYGTTTLGGETGLNGHGVLYEIDPAKNDSFSLVFQFQDTALRAVDNLVLADNGKLYGLATGAEFSSDPTQWAIREYDVENKSFKNLFKSQESDYEYNFSQFLYLNNKLYGVVARSSTEGSGYLFEFDLSTNQLIKKVVFPANGSDGSWAQGNLTLSSNGNLWGMTNEASGDDNGVIYEYNPSDDSFVNHYGFSGTDGRNPMYSNLVETAGVDYTGIKPFTAKSSFRAYPNPTSDFVRFDLENNAVQKVDYAIYDISGKQILSETLNVQNALIVDLSGYKSGIYVVKINTNKQIFSKTIIRK